MNYVDVYGITMNEPLMMICYIVLTRYVGNFVDQKSNELQCGKGVLVTDHTCETCICTRALRSNTMEVQRSENACEIMKSWENSKQYINQCTPQ